MKDRWFALCGIASVVVELVGTFIQMGSKDTHSLTWTSSDSAIAKAFSHHATTVVWVGAYLEIVSAGLFLVFAVWLCTRLGAGVLGSIGRAMAIVNAAAGLTSLALLSTAAYLAGHALPLSTARVLVTLNGATYVTTWFTSAFFLLAVAPLALAQGRRIIGWSAVAIAAETLIGAPVNPGNLGQFSSLFTLIWVAGTCIALLRREPRHAPVPAVA
jgi:hypothetical protein